MITDARARRSRSVPSRAAPHVTARLARAGPDLAPLLGARPRVSSSTAHAGSRRGAGSRSARHVAEARFCDVTRRHRACSLETGETQRTRGASGFPSLR